MSPPVTIPRRRKVAFLGLIGVSCLLAIEAGYRVFDPFPYFPTDEINAVEQGNVSRYDDQLGWTGVPSGQTTLTTENSRTRIELNRLGFRDLEHADSGRATRDLVFLGDSFTWGFEVEADQMFVNRMRRRLPGWEVYNLSHRGYGTDQSMLTFDGWRHPSPTEWVVLMFCENDLRDNISTTRYGKAKPLVVFEGEQTFLSNVPVPRVGEWDAPASSAPAQPGGAWLRWLFRSQLAHDVWVRLAPPSYVAPRWLVEMEHDPELVRRELAETRQLLGLLRAAVAGRGGRLVVVAIPDKRQVTSDPAFQPYQPGLRRICTDLGIEFFDLAPAFLSARGRTYFRLGQHWNERGHAVAARALLEYLEPKLALPAAVQP